MTPDPFKHPSELYRNTDLAQTPISLQKNTQKVVTYWSKQQKQIDVWMPEGFVLDCFHVFASLDDKPKVQISRDQFDAQASNQFNFRFATQENLTVVIGLPLAHYALGRVPPMTFGASEVLTFGDFPEDLRDQIWRRACAAAIQNSLSTQASMNQSQNQTPPTPPKANPPPPSP